MRDYRVLTTRESVNEDGETELRPVLAVVDRSRYSPTDKGSHLIGPAKPGRNTDASASEPSPDAAA